MKNTSLIALAAFTLASGFATRASAGEVYSGIGTHGVMLGYAQALSPDFAVRGDFGGEDHPMQLLENGKRPLLVGLHQPRVTDDVSCHDRLLLPLGHPAFAPQAKDTTQARLPPP